MSRKPNSPTKNIRHRPPNYASRSVQMRLFVLVGSLMLIFILMSEAAKPANWRWLWQLTPTETAPVDQNVDTRAPDQAGPATTEASNADSFTTPLVLPIAGTPANAENRDGSASPLIDATRLTEIQDDTVFQAREAEPWFYVLECLKRTSEAEVQANSVGRIGFAQLFQQTAELRGQVVEIHGSLRRIVEKQATQNQMGIDRYWQCWIKPEGATNSPVVVYCLDLPDGLTPAVEMQVPVTCFGVCYKRWPYQAQEEMILAPVLLAKTMQSQQNPSVAGRELPSRTTVLGMLVASATIALIVVVWVFKRG
ncbi:MAG: hypothetical protein KDA87_00060 [Planctomycetales bacterium]|nr:hypothetical protein [Planctomycetales bacterium]